MALCTPNTSALGNYLIVADVGHLPVGDDRYSGVQAYQVDAARLWMFDGNGWVVMSEPAQTWTPSFGGGMTVGNGVWSSAYYHRSDGFCEFNAVFTLGSTSAVTGFLFINVPKLAWFMEANGYAVEYGDNSAGTFFRGVPGCGATASMPLWALALNPTYVAVANTSATVPFTWAVNDTIKISGRYRMQTRYL